MIIIYAIASIALFLVTGTISAKIWFSCKSSVLSLLIYFVGALCAYIFIGNGLTLFLLGFGIVHVAGNARNPVEAPPFFFRNWRSLIYFGTTLIIISVGVAISQIWR